MHDAILWWRKKNAPWQKRRSRALSPTTSMTCRRLCRRPPTATLGGLCYATSSPSNSWSTFPDCCTTTSTLRSCCVSDARCRWRRGMSRHFEALTTLCRCSSSTCRSRSTARWRAAVRRRYNWPVSLDTRIPCAHLLTSSRPTSTVKTSTSLSVQLQWSDFNCYTSIDPRIRIVDLNCRKYVVFQSYVSDNENQTQTNSDVVSSGGDSAVKEPGHFEVRKSSSQVTRMHFFSSKKLTTFFSCRP